MLDEYRKLSNPELNSRVRALSLVQYPNEWFPADHLPHAFELQAKAIAADPYEYLRCLTGSEDAIDWGACAVQIATASARDRTIAALMVLEVVKPCGD